MADRPPSLSWWVALRALVWSTLFAGTVAVYIPWRYFSVAPSRARLAPTGVVGMILVVTGAALMLGCVSEFVARGRGTPAPMDPPRALVVHGPSCERASADYEHPIEFPQFRHL